jgi:hypothetical protein
LVWISRRITPADQVLCNKCLYTCP